MRTTRRTTQARQTKAIPHATRLTREEARAVAWYARLRGIRPSHVFRIASLRTVMDLYRQARAAAD